MKTWLLLLALYVLAAGCGLALDLRPQLEAAFAPPSAGFARC